MPVDMFLNAGRYSYQRILAVWRDIQPTASVKRVIGWVCWPKSRPIPRRF